MMAEIGLTSTLDAAVLHHILSLNGILSGTQVHARQLNPARSYWRRLHQGLHNNTVLLGFLFQRRQLLRRSLWRIYIEPGVNVLKTNGHVL
jgi:hypothetical protein